MDLTFFLEISLQVNASIGGYEAQPLNDITEEHTSIAKDMSESSKYIERSRVSIRNLQTQGHQQQSSQGQGSQQKVQQQQGMSEDAALVVLITAPLSALVVYVVIGISIYVHFAKKRAKVRKAQKALKKEIDRLMPEADAATEANDYEQNECAICLQEFETDAKLRKIDACRHVFHSECIILHYKAWYVLLDVRFLQFTVENN